MNIRELKNRHLGEPCFCIGTAPHLDNLDLSLLRDHVTIGVNQLFQRADEINLDYNCFLFDHRFAPFREQIPQQRDLTYCISSSITDRLQDWVHEHSLSEQVCEVNTRFTSTGHAECFSFDLTQTAYAANTIELAIHLAVWMGCNPIYLIGVDAHFKSQQEAFYDSSPELEVDLEACQKHAFPDFAAWLRKVHNLLRPRGIRLINAAGQESSLETLPRMRYRAAAGDPKIAITSKTFCGDDYLVSEISRFFPRYKLNEATGKLAGDALVDFLSDADVMILGTEPFTADVIEQLPYLRFVSKYGVGLNNVDFAAARQHDMEVVYRKGVNSDSVSELVLALSIMMLRRIDQSIQGYRHGQWQKLPGRELAEMTVGIVGYGHVGKVVARKFAQLGVVRILVHDLLDVTPELHAEVVPFDYLVRESDIISFHISMEPRNHHLVNADLLAQMKPDALLINTSRGEILDETALANALRDGHLGGAALDVYEDEPTPNPDLLDCPRLLTTCHIAGSSNRAIKNMGWAAIEGLLKLLNKKPI